MITLSFLKLLENNNFGTIDVDLFYQKLTLDSKGVYISDIGDPVAKGSRDTQSYELLARGSTDIDGRYKLSQIRKFILANYSSICELPSMSVQIEGQDVIIPDYKNVELSKPSTITNVGLDANNRIIYSMTGTIIYKEK
jgi:hypothetical protein